MSRTLCIKNFTSMNSFDIDDSIKIAMREESELWVFFIVTPNMVEEVTLQDLEEEISKTITVKNDISYKWKLVLSDPDCFMKEIMDIYPVKSIIGEGIDFSSLMGRDIRDVSDVEEIFGCRVLSGKKQRNAKWVSLAIALSSFFVLICLFIFSPFFKTNYFSNIKDTGSKGDKQVIVKLEKIVKTHTLPVIALIVLVLNLPFGFFRVGVKKFSLPWFLAVHSPVPIVIGLRFFSGLGWHFITFPVLIGAFLSGQYLGGKLFQWRYS